MSHPTSHHMLLGDHQAHLTLLFRVSRVLPLLVPTDGRRRCVEQLGERLSAGLRAPLPTQPEGVR
jgi:hypothetical protein